MDARTEKLFDDFYAAHPPHEDALNNESFYPADATDLLVKFLGNRGMDHAGYREMDTETAGRLLDIDKACRVLHDARVQGDPVTILPDFDMDGIMSGVVGMTALSQFGFDVQLYVPDPKAGYGFDERTVDDLMHKHPRTRLILTCDNGIGCRAGTLYAKRSHNVTVVITDHHVENVANTTADVADVCVDPCRVDDPYPTKSICGAHVLWMVMRRYGEIYSPENLEHIDRLRVFAGLGTISDMMDLVHENRQLVRDAVSLCRSIWSLDWFLDKALVGAHPVMRHAFEGLAAVLRVWTESVSDDDKGHKLTRLQDINEEFFGYYVAPMFNAAKRLDLDMAWPFGLFMGWYGSLGSAFGVARYLYATNNSRKDTVQLYLQRLRESEASGMQPFAPYAYVYDNSSAKSGILGLVANNLCQSSGHPVLVLKRQSDGVLSGSGRSPSWYPYLSRVVPHGFWAAGHEGAFGVKFPTISELSRWRDFIESDVDLARAEFEKAIADGLVHVQPPYDIVVDDTGAGDVVSDIDLLDEFLEDVERYRPFGRSFSEPVFKVVFDVSTTERQGMSFVHDEKGSHYKHGKFMLSSGLTAICFGQGDAVMAASSGTHYVVGALEDNVFRGRRSLQVRGELDAEVTS